MKNPLLKRLPKEFVGEIGKYLVIFLFMTATIGFISGFIVADGSMMKAYQDSFDKYNIEDGNFELYQPLTEESREKIQTDNQVELYDNYYMEKSYLNKKKKETVIRIFKNREQVNKVDVMKGKIPSSDNEIALDRLFARNNQIQVGDILHIEGKDFTVSGLVAFSDYSALFQKNTDIMFDSILFGVGVMTKEGYDSINTGNEHYNYSYSYTNDRHHIDSTDENAKTYGDELLKSVYGVSVSSGNTLSLFLPQYQNQAINFTGNDMGSDKSMMIVLLYILIVILAFVFGVTTNNTIAKEASVIGTLRASGYTRGEILRHYMYLPVGVTFLSAMIGNILGYTVFKNISIFLYYNSYSLPSYETVWSGEAFLLTTVIPMILMIIINLILIYKKLKFSPLRFLRNDLSKSKRKKAVKLPHFKFIRRFRLRVIIQNRSSYITLFIGILFANLLLMFGEMLGPLINHYADESEKHMICSYQYILKEPQKTANKEAEGYFITSLIKQTKLYGKSEITVYGIQNKSPYVPVDIKRGTVYISNTMADKFRLKKNDTFTVKDEYEDKIYKWKVGGIYNYPASLSIFMNVQDYAQTFQCNAYDYNGYFSNEKLDDIQETNIASMITKNDMVKIARQLNVSMGEMMSIINVFAIALFGMLVYLLTKLIIEKNAVSISMIKILGYDVKEISKIYLLSTSMVVIGSTILSFVLDTLFLKVIYRYIMAEMQGWLLFYMKKDLYPRMFLYGILLYVIVMLLQMRKIKKIPMTDALKMTE